ncbi:MAG: type II toxin-antitoxin system prevent-host-death family antitoxin [Candidatus Obscuribacterales bacterium]|jgi:prevent-host-death family protein|nr:type II toxin-antitoxin system prevent-host-death family antitoxin [Candidatus Obscuribacterales bacterium]
MAKAREIPAGEFKSKCLQLMEQVSKSKTPIIITKRGKPIAKLVPLDEEAIDGFGCMKGSVRILGDIVEPLDVQWEANG